MMRTTMLALATTAALSVMMPSPGATQQRGMGAGGGTMSGGAAIGAGGAIGGGRATVGTGSFQGNRVGAGGFQGNRAATFSGSRSRFAFRDRDDFRFRDRDDFRFRHHRFFRHHFFRHHFAFAAIDGGCFVVRRVWTPWGWHWRRIWVC